MTPLKILFSIPTKHHVEIALDELEGLQDQGYLCSSFPYAAKEGYNSSIGKLYIIIKNAINLVRIAYGFKPDVVYLNSRLEVLAGTRDFITISIFRLFYYQKVKFLIKSHGSDIDVIHHKGFMMSKVVLPFLKKQVSGWLFLSTEERDKVKELHYFKENRIFVTKNIVRIHQFEKDPLFKSRLNIPEDQQVLLFVGRIISEKGIFDVIDAFSVIHKSHAATLIIVGDGADFTDVKDRIKALNLSDKVVFTGFIPEQDVVAFYANSDVLVFPTYFPEGFPMALFNSVAAGLSIVTTPIRAATDFLSEPENCLWAEPQNSGSVANLLKKLLSSNSLRLEMSRNNLKKAVLFGKDQVAKELAQTIETIMKNENH